MTTLAEYSANLRSSSQKYIVSGDTQHFDNTTLYAIKKSIAPAIKAIQNSGGTILGVENIDEGKIVTVKEKNGKEYRLFVKNQLDRSIRLTRTLANYTAPTQSNYVPVAPLKAEAQDTSTITPQFSTSAKAPLSSSESLAQAIDTLPAEAPQTEENAKPSMRKKAVHVVGTASLVSIGAGVSGWALTKLGATELGGTLTRSSAASGRAALSVLNVVEPISAIVRHVVIKPVQMGWHGLKATIHGARTRFTPKAKMPYMRSLVKLRSTKKEFLLTSLRSNIKSNGIMKTLKSASIKSAQDLTSNLKGIVTPFVDYFKPIAVKVIGKAGTSPAAVSNITAIAMRFVKSNLANTVTKITTTFANMIPPASAASKLIATRASIPALVMGLFANPIGKGVTRLTGSAVAGQTTAGVISSVSTGVGVGSMLAMVASGPVGWVGLGIVALATGYYCYKAYKNAKEQNTEATTTPSAIAAR